MFTSPTPFLVDDADDLSSQAATIDITAVSAGFLHSKLLNVAEGQPLLMNTRVAYSDGKPFEYNESVFRPDLMQISIDFSVLPPEHL